MTNLASGAKPEDLSAVEQIKAASKGLAHPVEEQLADPEKEFDDAAIQVLKHHGSYQQDNRDSRRERRKAGLGKEYYMMVRTKTPGGVMTPEQYLLCDKLCTKYGQNDMRVTSRQGFQFHGVVKGNLRPLIHDLNHLQNITTKGACGDNVRNVMACPVADIDPAFTDCGIDLIGLSTRISDLFLWKHGAYVNLWLDDEKVVLDGKGGVTYKKDPVPGEEADDPIYGRQMLPRKFKIGLALESDNSIDVYTQDLGIIALTENGKVTAFEILAGGGLGFSHSKPETYPRLGTHLTCVETQDELLRLCEAIVKVQRDYGERKARHQARLKYTIDRLGETEFKRLVAEYAGLDALPAPTGRRPAEQPDYLGWHKQNDGRNYVGVWIENGRIRDFEEGIQFRSGLRTITEKFRPSVRLTAHHNVIFANIEDADVDAVQAILDEHRIPIDKNIAAIRRHEMACPALPLCGLALAEAERELPRIMDELVKLGHAGDDVVIRMTGCPNSCARPETAEIGIIGRGPNKYNIYTGGDRLGARQNELLAENIGAEQLPGAISALLNAWKENKTNGDSFGDWAHQQGIESLKPLVEV